MDDVILNFLEFWFLFMLIVGLPFNFNFFSYFEKIYIGWWITTFAWIWPWKRYDMALYGHLLYMFRWATKQLDRSKAPAVPVDNTSWTV